jgi:hypothetical protein
MHVTTNGPSAKVPPKAESVQRYRKIFPSYSHQDSAVVASFAVAARALGDQYLQDVLTLRAGERWDAHLLELIEDADVFQLFWSRNSMRSPHCRDEWQHALALQRPLFIRPIYWEDPLPEDLGQGLPPAGLRALHFVKVPVAGTTEQRTEGGLGGRPARSGQGTQEALIALAALAGNTVVSAASTDAWEACRRECARLLGRGDPRKTEIARLRLTETQQQLAAAEGADLESARAAQTQEWEVRFADLVDEDPDIVSGLRALVEEVRAQLPAGVVSAAGHAVAAGRDVKISASEGGVAAGLIHGGLAYSAGPASGVVGPGASVAAHGGVAIGHVVHRRPEVAGLPVFLAPRPVLLAGREELLTELDARLARGDGSWPRVVALCGLGGAGKTSVAVEYAYRHLAEAGVVWQFPAEDPTVLAAEFGELAAQLGVRDLVDTRDPVVSVHAVLARFAAGWLLIFDDAADLPSVAAFLPPAGLGRVLITTRNPNWPGQTLEVPVLDTDVAADFLISRTGDPDRQTAALLADELGGLPLALEQAAAYIQTTGTTLAGYMSTFRDRRAELLARGEASGHPADVAATLGLTLSRLVDEDPVAAGLLRLLACLAPEPVPLALLLSDARIAGKLPPGVAAVLRPLLGDPVAAGDGIAALRRYSLVTPAGGGLVLVHRLVQAITLAQAPADSAGQWEQAAAVLVEAAIPADTDLPAAWPACAALLPHARAVLDLTSGGMWQIATYLGESGSYPAARDLFRLIADAYSEDEAYGPEHPETLAARANLAYWTGEAGNAAGARDQYAALLPISERVYGPEHPHTLTARANLASWTGEAGDAAGARDQFAALLPLHEGVLGPEHPDTLTARANLAYWTGKAGDAAGARDQFAALLPVDERVLSPEHPHTLATRQYLAYWTEKAEGEKGAE